MSTWGIAWRSINQRGLASLLTGASMGLGVMLVVMVLSIHGIVARQFLNNASLGYNLILGAKGGKLQLTLNSVYYLSQPIENISYRFYSEFLNQQQRDAAMSSSLDVHGAQLTDALRVAGLSALGPTAALGGSLELHQHAAGAFLGLTDVGRPGKYADVTAFAVPLCLGDYYGRFRVVGTTPDFLEKLRRPADGEPLALAAGRNLRHWSEEHGYFEAVVGSSVAREMNVGVDSEFSPAHGTPEGEGHEDAFHIVGVMAPSGTPNDRVVLVNMEGFYLMSNHAKPLENNDPFSAARSTQRNAEDRLSAPLAQPAQEQPTQPPTEPKDHAALHRDPLPAEQREVTAVLLRTSHPFAAVQLQNLLGEGNDAQAVQPTKEIFELMESIVQPFQNVLLLLAVLICIVSGISILVSMYNSMSDRKQEIAVMRALGARRGTVMTIILMEAIMLAVGGGFGGWVTGHAVNSLLSGPIESRTGVRIGFTDFAPPVNVLELLGGSSSVDWINRLMSVSTEVLLIPGLIILAVIVGFLPAVTAYRADVARSLAP